jgi:hypothetical protein
VTVEVWTVNVPVVDPPGTTMLAGSVTFDKLVRRVIVIVSGSALASVTAHVLAELELNVVGLHCSEEIPMAEEAKVTVTLCEEPL